MHSWVRYSVSVYLGLLLAGSIASSEPPTPRAHPPVASIRQMREAPSWYLVPRYDKPPARSDRPGSSAES